MINGSELEWLCNHLLNFLIRTSRPTREFPTLYFNSGEVFYDVDELSSVFVSSNISKSSDLYVLLIDHHHARQDSSLA
jgi:hypothetical protein